MSSTAGIQEILFRAHLRLQAHDITLHDVRGLMKPWRRVPHHTVNLYYCDNHVMLLFRHIVSRIWIQSPSVFLILGVLQGGSSRCACLRKI